MKVKIEYDDKLEDDEIIINATTRNLKVDHIIKILNEENNNFVTGKMNQKIYLVDQNDIESFYAYDSSIYFFSKGHQYKINEKLFELQLKYETRDFLRISKSVIINIKMVEYLAPAFNKKLIFKMNSGKEEYSSRTYYNDIKKKLGV